VKEVETRVEANRNRDNGEGEAKDGGEEVNGDVEEVQKKGIVEVGKLRNREVGEENNISQAVGKLGRELKLSQR